MGADFNPMELARAQIAFDRARTRRYPHTLHRKIARMRVSPLAFLRGAMPLFYQLMSTHPELRGGPAGEGWFIGDLHIENFGAFVGEKHSAPVFDLNDFDECMLGPLWLDLIRLSTSLLLAARELGASGGQTLAMVVELAEAWSAHVRHAAPMPPMPRAVQKLIDQVGTRARVDLLNARSRIVRGRRRFVRGPRYSDLPAAVAKHLPDAFDRYIDSLPPAKQPDPKQLEILDSAFRIAGTGSLGQLRIAVLVRGKGGLDGAWVFDLKEQRRPVGRAFGRIPPVPPAERALTGMHACLASQPRLAGVTQLDGISMLGRRLAPQEDKLDLTRIDGDDLPPLARYLGALLGNAHRRGAAAAGEKPPARWSTADRSALIERAIKLAGIHEATYLAYCELTG